MHSLFVPNDPLYTAQWNLQTIGMEQAWDINPGGTSSVVVAVLDSGVAYRNAIVRQTIHAYKASATLTLPALGLIALGIGALARRIAHNRHHRRQGIHRSRTARQGGAVMGRQQHIDLAQTV